mgnify:CR=1 FL=1
MAKGKTDFRQLKAKRAAALARPELRHPPKEKPPSAEDIAKAIAEGKFRKLPDEKKPAR